MIFFQRTANLADNDKSRIEFLLSQVAILLGHKRVEKEVLSLGDVIACSGQSDPVKHLTDMISEHLEIDLKGFSINQELTILNKKEGGGGG